VRAVVVALCLVTGAAHAAPKKAKPLVATFSCAAIDDAAQRRPLDGKKRTARPKTVHKVECAVASTDARIMEAKATGKATWSKGHAEVDGTVVGDKPVKKEIRRLMLVEMETDAWPRCDDVDIELAIKDEAGAQLWAQVVKTSGSCR